MFPVTLGSLLMRMDQESRSRQAGRPTRPTARKPAKPSRKAQTKR